MAIILAASLTGLKADQKADKKADKKAEQKAEQKADKKAEQYNEYLFDCGDGSTYGINRVELATYPPEDAAQFLLILEYQYGAARTGELQQEEYMVPIDQDTESAGGLVETSIEEEFIDMECDEEGFLSASVEQSPAKYGISADLALVDSFPTSIYLESIPNKESDMVSSTCDSFPVATNTTDGIDDKYWESTKSAGSDGQGLKIAWNIDQKKPVPGPGGSWIQGKFSYSGTADGGGKRWKVIPRHEYAGRTVTERDSNFSANVDGELKWFWGADEKKFNGKKLGVTYEATLQGEMGLKGSIGTSFGTTNKFVDRNARREGMVELGGNIRFSVSAYAEGKAQVKWKFLNGRWREISVSGGLELQGTLSLGYGFVAKDWDHTLKDTHPKGTEQYMRAWGAKLSYKIEGYLKFKVLGFEIKPSIRTAGSRSFNGQKTIKFATISALDKFM
jgi:hypothetical protein